jgi:hypothetical protein
MTPPPDPEQLEQRFKYLVKQSLIRYVNRNTPIQIRLALLLAGLVALLNPGGVVIEMCVQCVRRRDELPDDIKELFYCLANLKE